MAILVNLPSNDQASSYSDAEQLENYDHVIALAREHDLPLWLTTTQPRNFENSAQKRRSLIRMRAQTKQRYAEQAIDFWELIATEEGRIQSEYDSGDRIHLNGPAHAVLFKRVVSVGIPSQLDN